MPTTNTQGRLYVRDTRILSEGAGVDRIATM